MKLSADSDAVLGAATREHIATLEHGFAERATCAIGDGGPDRGAHVDFDVILAGGGLSLVYGAYLAREVPAPDPELTRVGPGTPCGEYLRRFWQPVAFARDLRAVPLRIIARLKEAFYDLALVHTSIEIVTKNKLVLVDFEQTAQARYAVGRGV